jgi:hypothetical protein
LTFHCGKRTGGCHDLAAFEGKLRDTEPTACDHRTRIGEALTVGTMRLSSRICARDLATLARPVFDE